MFTVTLLTNPEKPNLDNRLVENLRAAWGGDQTRWLAVQEAAEFSVLVEPDNFWDVWSDLQDLNIDLVIQPTEGRRKALLLADMDSTMIQQECIDELAAEAGVGPQVVGITARAMNGDLDFEQALKERVGLLKGLKASVIDTVLTDRITLMPGAVTLLATMKASGAYAALVSGGFTDFTKQIASTLGFDEHCANSLLTENGLLTGKVAMPILGKDAKVAALNSLVKKLEITSSQVLAVGDGANDLGMLGLAGAGVALHAKPSVAAACKIRINHGDLTALLFLQGYTKDEFVS